MSGGRTSLGEAGHCSCAFKEYVCALPPPTASYHMISAMMLMMLILAQWSHPAKD